jgi:adenylate cyclase
MGVNERDRRESRAARVESPWLPYLPRHVVDTLVRAPALDPVAREDRFRAAVLFADMSGFTPIVEAFGRGGDRATEELTDVLNGYFGAIIAVIESFGGSVAKFGGDAVTALFPSGGGEPRAVRRAIQSALDMQGLMPRYASLTTSAGTFRLSFKAGLSVGEVLATTVGFPDVRLEHVIAGEPVDRSVAAEHRAKPGEILWSGSIPAAVTGLELETVESELARVLRQAPRARRSPPHRLTGLDLAVEETLAAYLHPSVGLRMRAGHGRFSNEHRRVTALFLGFPPLDYSVPGVAWDLQSRLSPALRVLARLEGHLYQVDIGDKGTKAIACFGAPVAHEDDEERALRFALEVRRLSPEVRIGVASGSVFFGEIGGPTRREYTAIGDTMNVAARLMQSAANGRILVSGVPERVLAAFVFHHLDPVLVKGKSAAVPVAELLAAPSAHAPANIGTHATVIAIVDRKSEMRRVRRRLEAVATSGAGRIIAITGEAGVGKSRLTTEVARVSRGLGFTVVAGSCQSQASRTPYLPWHSVLRALFGIDPAAPATEVPRLLAERLAELDQSFLTRMPLLAPALNVAIADTEMTTGLDPELRHELLTAFVTDLLRRRTAEAPILLLVEDCHWADTPSRSLMIAVARDAGRSRVVLMITSRPAEGHDDPLAWTRSLPGLTNIGLDALGDGDVERLATRTLRAEFGIVDLPRTSLRVLVERADGNPFVLEETLRLLHDRGIDPRDPRAVEAAALPDSLHSLVLARLDMLPPDGYATLKAASAIGRQFDATWLSEAYGDLGGSDRVLENLERLSALGLVERDETGGETGYRFRHALVREVAHGTLSIAHRQDLHEQLGRMIETRYAGDLDRFVDALAYHFGESRATDKQRRYFRMAADAARAAYANEAALAWLDRLLPLVDAAEAIDVLRASGEIKQLVGDWPGAEASFRRAIELAERGVADPIASAWATCSLGHLRTYIGSHDEARGLLENALSVFKECGDAEGEVRALEYLAFTAAEAADYESSLAWSRRHLDLAERSGDAVARCMATEQTGLAHWRRGDYAQAQQVLERALSIAQAIGYLRGVILTGNDLAGLFAEMDDHVRAFDLVRLALEAAREMGYRYASGILIGNAGELYRKHGDAARAVACASRGLLLSADLGARSDVAVKAGNIASALMDDGRPKAEAFLDVAEDLARSTDDRYALCECLEVRAELLLRRGEIDDARKRNEDALAIASEIARHDVRFASALLDIRLRFAVGELDELTAVGALQALMSPQASDPERAGVQFAIWQVTGDDDARRRAASTYRSLHEAVPNVLYRRRYLELTGDRLPDPDPLPSLSPDDEAAPRLEDVLRSARKILHETRRERIER